MEIKDKWVVREVRDNLYFTGMNSENYPVLESLNSRVRQYNSKRAAECAVRRIEESGIECCEFAAEHIKQENVPDVPSDKPVTAAPYDEQKEPPIIKNDGGWETLDSFGKKGQVQYLRKREALRYIFAVQCEDGDLRGFGFDEKRAWTWYSDYRREIGVRRIEERLGKQRDTERRNAEK